MKPGKELIAEERAKVLTKISREDDIIANQLGELSEAAHILADKRIMPVGDEIKFLKPAGWDIERWKMMCLKPYPERLVIAGQLYLAEADRCKAMAAKIAKQLDMLRTQG